MQAGIQPFSLCKWTNPLPEPSKPTTNSRSVLSAFYSARGCEDFWSTGLMACGLSEVVLNERQGCQHLNIISLSRHRLHLLWSLRHALANDALAFLLGLCLLLVILLHSLQESLVASGLAHVLNAHMDALAQLAVAHNLGHLNSQGIAVHVEDNSSPAMVERVWQSLLDGGVSDNVHIVSTLEVHQVPCQARSSLGPVLLGILVTSAMSVTLGDHTCLSHGCKLAPSQVANRLSSEHPSRPLHF